MSGWIGFLVPFFTTVAIMAIFTIGLNLQWGYTGIFNYGVVAFFMVGAYTAAIVTLRPASGPYESWIGGWGPKLDLIPGLNSEQWLPFIVAFAAAAAMAGLLALLLSIPTLRLREDYLAIASIGVAEVLRRVVIQEEWLVNGTRALGGIPHPFYNLVDPSDYKYIYLPFALFVLALVFFAVERIIRSPWGRVLRAVREDETTAAAAGKNVFKFKMQAFVIGAMIIGLGGALYAFDRGSLSTEGFTHLQGTFIIWVMLIIGGSGNNKGAIAGALVIWTVWSLTPFIGDHIPKNTFLTDTRVFALREVIIGVLIIAFLLWRSKGILPEEKRVSAFVEKEAKEEARSHHIQAPPHERVGTGKQ